MNLRIGQKAPLKPMKEFWTEIFACCFESLIFNISPWKETSKRRVWNYKVIHEPLSLILHNFPSAFQALCDLRQYSHRIMSHVFSPLTWGEVIKKARDRDYTLIPTVQSGLWTSPCIDLGECHTLMKTTKLFTVIPWCFTALVACCDSYIHLSYIYKTKEMN